MPRKRRNKDDAVRTKERVRSFRSRERRQRQSNDENKPTDLTWLTKVSIRLAAMRIINDRQTDRPYWLSIPYEGGPEPVSDYYPCTMKRRGDRLYYGFMFREHRDAVFEKWDNARKELTK